MEQEIKFSRDLIKGKIAETIFEQMLRNEGKYTVIPFGYEHTMPMLAQYRNQIQIEHIIKNISDAPDFALISENKKDLFLVEIKYQKELNLEKIKEYANELKKKWENAWIFVATPKEFYCGMIEWIIKENKINTLGENWVSTNNQKKYLNLLKEFEK